MAPRAGCDDLSVPWVPSMDRETALLVAVVMLSLAALAVGLSGWLLLARDRKIYRSASVADPAHEGHHEVAEEA